MNTDLAASPDPDLDSPLTLTLTPELIVHAVMESASAVHTGWESCVDDEALLAQVQAMDDTGDKAVRLVEQEFADEQDNDAVWHDWTVEVRIGRIYILGHWQLRTNAPPLDWEWNQRAAERAFERACVLLGRRTRRGLMIDEPIPRELPPRSSRH
jgi:hypothetical protein